MLIDIAQSVDKLAYFIGIFTTGVFPKGAQPLFGLGPKFTLFAVSSIYQISNLFFSSSNK